MKTIILENNGKELLDVEKRFLAQVYNNDIKIWGIACVVIREGEDVLIQTKISFTNKFYN